MNNFNDKVNLIWEIADLQTGELYDLAADPGEFENLWHDPAHIEIKVRLLKESFDALALGIDVGPKQVTWY